MNILIINADQLRHDCIGCRGIRPVKTPNIDSLAADGILYEDAYTPLPVCSPARQAMLCGRRPDSFGAQWNYDFMPTPELDPGICWPHLLRMQGWNLGYVGRFHVSATHLPQDFGFTDFGDMRHVNSDIAVLFPNVEYTGGWLGCENPIPLEHNRTHIEARKACDLLKKYAESGKQWLLWVDFEEPHLPCRPAKPFSEMYKASEIKPWDGWGDSFIGKPYIHKQQTLSWNTETLTWDDFAPMVARYYGCISQVDDAIGNILNALKLYGNYDETLIIFTSDHGDMCGSHSMLDKHYVLYDDIIRVPLIMKMPGIETDRINGFVMNCLDIPATIRKVTGLPEEELKQGSMLPVNRSEASKCPKQVLVTSNGQQFGLYTTRALRTEQYKYVWNLTDVDEFYDLKADPGEKNNLIGDSEYLNLVRQYRRELYTMLVNTGDRFAGNEWMKRQLLEDKEYVRQDKRL